VRALAGSGQGQPQLDGLVVVLSSQIRVLGSSGGGLISATLHLALDELHHPLLVVLVHLLLLPLLLLVRQRLRVPVDVGDEPSLLGLVHRTLAGAAQVLDELGQRLPLGGVHVQVLLEGDVLLVHLVGGDSLGAEPATEQFQIALLKLLRK